jgi:hypothetical protein
VTARLLFARCESGSPRRRTVHGARLDRAERDKPLNISFWPHEMKDATHAV